MKREKIFGLVLSIIVGAIMVGSLIWKIDWSPYIEYVYIFVAAFMVVLFLKAAK